MNRNDDAMAVNTKRSLSPPSGESDIFVCDDASTDFLILNAAPVSNSQRSQRSLSLRNVWDAYRAFVKKNQISLHLADEAITRVLFWMPRDVVRSSAPVAEEDKFLRLPSRRLREICFGLLSLHRMVMDLALQDVIINSYGTTMSLDDEEPSIPATSLRICLTMFHDLMPTLLEMYSSSRSSSHLSIAARQANLRLQLERLKFLLRLRIAMAYWRQVWKKNQTIHTRPVLLAGLIQDGSIFYPDESSHDHRATPTLMQERSYFRRQQYSGRRTGRRVIGNQQLPNDSYLQCDTLLSTNMARLAVGELWNMYRPLCWAQVEANNHVAQNKSRWAMWWLVSLAMDCLSLKLLEQFTSTNNADTKAEWNRRRVKLFLYVLRSPFWDEATFPGAQRLASDVLRRIPLVGQILEAYLWDWIYYWKHPWASERD